MTSFLKKIIKNESGQVLPAVLALLVLGGLIVVPGLDYATTSLNSGRNIQRGIKGIYAAEAGIENALWCLGNGTSPDEQLAGTINQGEVGIQTADSGNYTLYFGKLVEAGGHSNYLGVDGEIVWDGGEGAYKYTITVTWQPEQGSPTIHLKEVGARLPVGYSYQWWSADDFEDNLSTYNPTWTLDTYGAYLLKWVLPGNPYVSQSNPVATQEFYINGTGELEGDYTWVVASRGDIGEVGEVSGTLYTITSTATDPASCEVTAEIVADVVMDGGTACIVAWRVIR